jgi:hypothetical protein
MNGGVHINVLLCNLNGSNKILEATLTLERFEEKKAKKEAESQVTKDKVTTSMDHMIDEELLQATLKL